MKPFLPRGWAALAVMLCAGLTGCAEQMAATAPLDGQRAAARPAVSPRGAPLALTNLEGAPAAVLPRFWRETNTAAAAREITTADAGGAAYLARGYLSAITIEGGAVFVSVWDLYDRGRKRVQRIEDTITVRGAASDPWALADDRALAALAGRSADSLALALSTTPEAIAAARPGPVVATDPAPARAAASLSAFR